MTQNINCRYVKPLASKLSFLEFYKKTSFDATVVDNFTLAILFLFVEIQKRSVQLLNYFEI